MVHASGFVNYSGNNLSTCGSWLSYSESDSRMDISRRFVPPSNRLTRELVAAIVLSALMARGMRGEGVLLLSL